MKLVISFGSAFALHAAVAAGVILHRPVDASVFGQAGSAPAVVEVEQLPPPVPAFAAVALNSVAASAKASHTRSTVSVHVEAVTAPITSATTDDTVPEPLPVSPPPRFHAATAMAAVTVTAGAETQTFAESDVTERARCIASPDPVYPAEALAADDAPPDTQLRFELVVSTNGFVDEVRALDHAGHGFDESALAALRSYRFTPAKRDGQPVRVRMPWTVQFKLK